MTDIVEQITKGLNDQQHKAVTLPCTTHCLVLAGAGCGKTAVLIRRIAFCAATYCAQDRILALTFTRKAAQEMQQRLGGCSGIDMAARIPSVTTFHSFGLHLIRDTCGGIPNFERLGYLHEPALMTARQRLEAIAAVSTVEDRRELHLSLTELDDVLSQHAVNPKKLHRLPPDAQQRIERIAEAFALVKKQQGCWEFSDMVQEALRLLNTFNEVKNHYAHLFSYILVDEFQDTNPLQINLLNSLLFSDNRVFAVGDDDQAIYGFQGADTGPILNFDSYFPEAVLCKLEINYRSTPAILQTANRIFRKKPPTYRKVLLPGKFAGKDRYTGVKPEKKIFRDSNVLCTWLVNKAVEIEKKEKIPVSEMVCLFRLNETLEFLKKQLVNHFKIMPQFLTVHSSKGLEFPVVFLCDLEESIFPYYKEKVAKVRTWADLIKSLLHLLQKKKHTIPSVDMDEEQRLFYVAVTRAERYLFLLSLQQKHFHGRELSLRLSRFVRLV